MEDNGADAAAAPATSMLPAEKHEAIPDAAAAATTNGSAGEENKVEGDAPAPALLPCGPRKTGLHLFVMNIRCARLLVRSCIIYRTIADQIMLERADQLATYDAIRYDRSVFKLDDLGSEVLRIAVPASLALAADPLASLVDTAFIGRLGNINSELNIFLPSILSRFMCTLPWLHQGHLITAFTNHNRAHHNSFPLACHSCISCEWISVSFFRSV